MIEIAAVKFDENGKIFDTFDTFIQPGRLIPPIITHITGITNKDLEKAPDFKEIEEKLAQFISSHPIVGHNIPFDIGFLRNKGLKLNNALYDTLDLASILLPGLPSYSLDTLTRTLKIKHQDRHRALSDTIATQELFSLLFQKIKGIDPDTMAEIEKVLDKSTWALRDLFFSVNPKQQKTEPTKETKEPTKKNTFTQKQFENFFAKDGPLAQVITDYECRPSQTEITKKISESFQLQRHLLLEAGTGTGKTIAYLATAVHFAQQQKKKIIISTYTKNLQDQIITKDIPLLQKALKTLSKKPNFSVALLKGRTNYVSMKRLHTFMLKDSFNNHEVTFLLKIIFWLKQTTTGDIEELNLQGKEFPLRFEICYDEGSNDENDPKYAHQSFLKRAREKAENADIIVVNHALLLQDAISESSILPEYDYIIFDEAHHLEKVTTNSLTINFSTNSFLRPFEKIGRRDEDLTQKCNQIITKAELFFGLLGIFSEKHAEPHELKWAYLIKTDALNSLEWKKVQNSAEQLHQIIQELLQELEHYSNDDEDILRDIKTFAYDIQRHQENLSTVFLTDQWKNRIQWVYQTYEGNYCLKSAPHNVGLDLQNILFNAKKSVILTSATLQTENNFDFIRDQLSLTPKIQELALPSHFDYPEQVKIIIPENLPRPNTEGYFKACSDAIRQIIKANGGRTLVLFTSKKALSATYMAIAPDLKKDGFNVLAQGVTGGKGKILEHFKEEPETSALFGTASFWEGIDIPGNLLSCIVMQKLPFDPPSDPLIYSRGLQYTNAFNEYQVPLAILRFKQGFGRLIRTSKDKGSMVILDSRIIQNSYGQKFLQSLPNDIRLEYGDTENIASFL